MEKLIMGCPLMKVTILDECGLKWAYLGLSLNKTQSPNHMGRVANKLAPLDRGHNKFMESITVWVDITAPRYWWQQFDTYRVGVTKQSESTRKSEIKKFKLVQSNFQTSIPRYLLFLLNRAIKKNNWSKFKGLLPESYLQRRIVCTNYKSLRNIYQQRKNHEMIEWKVFIKKLETDLKYFKFLQ